MAFRLIFAVGVAAAAQSDDHVAFDEWKQTHARRYASEEEEAQRFEIFQANLRYYEARTANDTAVYGTDELSDRTYEEWMALRISPDLAGKLQALDVYCFDPDNVDSDEDVQSVLQEYGDEIDWQAKGAVTGVKNQGSYGTCWSFTAAAVMEGINVAQGENPLESISEQEMIDCAHQGANVGRTMDLYYKKQHIHPVTEKSYPYKGSKGTCRRDSATLTKSGVKETLCPPNLKDNNQDNMLANLMKLGPGGFLLDAGGLHGYRSGIISNAGRKPTTNHATTVVGAGEENGVPYFRCKNSWGASFGEHGYYRVKRNTNPAQLGNPGGIFGVYDGFDSVLV